MGLFDRFKKRVEETEKAEGITAAENSPEAMEALEIRQRLTGMTAGQASFPLVSSIFNFKQHGESGAWMSDLMPHTSKIVDELCFIKSMYTEEINHDPAVTFIQSGSNLPGRPSKKFPT